MAYDKGKQMNPGHKEQKQGSGGKKPYSTSSGKTGGRKGYSSKNVVKNNAAENSAKDKENRPENKPASGKYKGVSDTYAYKGAKEKDNRRNYQENRAKGEKRDFGGENKARGEKRDFGGENKARGEKRDFGEENKARGEKRDFGGENKARGGKRDFGGENKARGEKRNFGSKNVERKGSDRADICPAAKRCGGCKWINKPYEEQLKMKEQWVKEQLAPFCKPEPIIGMKQPAHYRNKVHAVFGMDKQHNYISGIYEEGTHNIVPIESCYIEDQRADAIIQSIRKLLKSFKIKIYKEDTGYGLLRHVMIRTGYATGQIMVVIVLGSPVMPSRNNFVKALLQLHPEITTIVLNVNNRDTSMVLGDKEQVIYGKGYIEDELCGKTFRISPKSFYQVNPVQTQKLYNKALELAALTGRETVIDAYCGTGTIGIIASAKAANVIGVELNGDAVKDARNNAKRNNVTNIQFYQNDAGNFLVEMARQQAQVDVVLMDPPRSGSDEAFLSSVALLKPARVVYISCNPETLARDLHFLTRKGYKVKKAIPVDMFPYTDVKHVETVTILVKKS